MVKEVIEKEILAALNELNTNLSDISYHLKLISLIIVCEHNQYEDKTLVECPTCKIGLQPDIKPHVKDGTH